MKVDFNYFFECYKEKTFNEKVDFFNPEFFHSFVLSFAKTHEYPLDELYAYFEENILFEQHSKTDELVIKEIANNYEDGIYSKLIAKFITSTLSISEQTSYLDSFYLEYGQKLLSKNSKYSLGYVFKVFDVMRYIYGLNLERTRFERISNLLYSDLLNDCNLKLLSDFVYAYRKRDYVACQEVMNDSMISKDELYTGILSFYMAIKDLKFEEANKILDSLRIRNFFIERYLRYGYSSFEPTEKFEGEFVKEYLKKDRKNILYLEFFVFLSIFRIIHFSQGLPFGEFSERSYSELFDSLHLNQFEIALILFVRFQFDRPSSYGEQIDYDAIYKDFNRNKKLLFKTQKRTKKIAVNDEAAFNFVLDSLVDRFYFDKTYRTDSKNKVHEVLVMNDFSFIVFDAILVNYDVEECSMAGAAS